MAFKALSKVIALTGLAPYARAAPVSCDSEECVARAEESEALAASTVLLQASLQQSRLSTAAQGKVQTALPGSLLRDSSDRFMELLSSAAMSNTTDTPQDDTDSSDLWPVLQLVNAGQNKDENDPLWASIHELIRRYLKYANKDNEEFVQLCEGGKMEQYAKRACTGSGGQDIVSGVSRDSYYCGSRSSGIDWGYLPVKEMCSAESGSAYALNGICGSLSKKQLVMNVFESVSKWKDDPRLINVPSVGCIMGVVNCDIYFCQHCERVGCTAHNKSSDRKSVV